ncbi:hypothetical protein CEP54_005082 [Fusarium duplospermum]|uniref:DAGKc domain-containing protein n=1 Tax=Fusarium duplospermum TaxID=1325734 RepID=A0A428QEM6_9HYPO|nr:hypothetical protein CEP54_005082 [Fusarium duplospermum]
MGSKQSPTDLSSEIVIVDNVSIVGDNLTWTRADVSEQAPRHELLFVFMAGKLGDSLDFLLCFLKQDLENKVYPFQLSVLRTTQIPSELLDLMVTGLPQHLQHGVTSKSGITNHVDIIVSTKSGTGLALTTWQDVLQPLWDLVARHKERTDGLTVDSSKSHYRVIVTESPETVREFSRQLWVPDGGRSSGRTVVLLTGDGGVVDLLNGSDGDEPPEVPPAIALLPLGTGNALFHSTHKPLYSDPGPTPLVHGLRTLFRGVAHDLPVFRASFSPGSRIVTFADKSAKSPSTAVDPAQLQKQETSVSHLQGAIVASYGFHASIVYESDTPEHRVHGDKRFGMVAQELLRESHAYAAEVSIRRRGSTAFEVIPRDKHAYVLTALVSNLERKFTISPATRPLDSRLRLVHFGPIGGERTMNVMLKAYEEGSHVGMKWDDGERVGYDEVDEVKITTLEDDERWRKVCIDGTIVEIPKGGHMSVKMLDHIIVRVLADTHLWEGQRSSEL